VSQVSRNTELVDSRDGAGLRALATHRGLRAHEILQQVTELARRNSSS
jgi:hypothetical protein